MSLGMGAMLHALGGGSDESASKYAGRVIKSASIDDEKMLITFEDDITIKIWDDGQSCCESRYMTCDDDVKSLVGGKLLKIEAQEGESKDEDYDVHEWVFVEVATENDHIKFCTHNEHNGYYGGFGLSITELT